MPRKSQNSMPVFKKDNKKMSETNISISSKHREDCGFSETGRNASPYPPTPTHTHTISFHKAELAWSLSKNTMVLTGSQRDKGFSKRNIHSTKHKTNTQQENNPVWLPAGPPLTFYQLSLKVEDCPLLNIISQQG